MKKFLIVFIILLILGGTAFFFGWVQLLVPPGQYGVINSKTHGIDQKVIQSGEFRWVWYRLLPTNVKITVFKIEQSKFPIKFNSTLPSGRTYASFVGLSDTDFSWDIQGEISFILNPNKLASLAAQHNITDQDELDAYQRKIAQDIEVFLLHSISAAASDNERLELLMAGSIDAQMEREILNKFPQIKDLSLSIHSAKYPDFILYRQLQLLYEEFLVKQRESISFAFNRRAETVLETQLHFEELERYGELLTRYPILLDYLLNRNNNSNR